MINQRIPFLTIIAAALISLCLPVLAAAQGSYDPWNRDRDYGQDRRDRDYRRDRRRDRDDDHNYGRDDDRRYDYDQGTLRDAVHRVKDRSKSFEKDVDRLLDRSRIDGTRREDHVNNDVKEFRRAAERLKDRVGDGRNLNRSEGEASNLLQAAEHVERMLSSLRADSRTYADWREIKADLRTIADVYGLRFNDYDDGYYRRGGYDPRDDRRDNSRWRLPQGWPFPRP